MLNKTLTLQQLNIDSIILNTNTEAGLVPVYHSLVRFMASMVLPRETNQMHNSTFDLLVLAVQ